jgi:rubrerythrin
MATDGAQAQVDAAGDYVQFAAAGDQGKGEYRCSDCSYGVTVHSTLPVCPKCSGRSWEQAPWSPFSRARQLRS